MSVLEKTIENAAVRYAKARGCIVRKMNGLGNRAWPDRMFLYGGRAAFIEFKRPGGVPTELQEHFLNELRKAGFRAVWTDVVADAKTVIDALVDGDP